MNPVVFGQGKVKACDMREARFEEGRPSAVVCEVPVLEEIALDFSLNFFGLGMDHMSPFRWYNPPCLRVLYDGLGS